MRSFVISIVALAALVVPGASQSTATVTKGVRILSTGFSPTTVTIATGDTVKWTNRDTKTHQVVSNNGSFASAIIAPGRSYSHTFNTAGKRRPPPPPPPPPTRKGPPARPPPPPPHRAR